MPNAAVSLLPRARFATSAAPLRVESLLDLAIAPHELRSVVMAGVVASSWQRYGWHSLPLFGLDGVSTGLLLERLFPGIAALLPCAWADLQTPPAFNEALELEDLLAMLLEQRTVPDQRSADLAHALATACLGDNHLWQDMQLPSRQMLSQLLTTHFTALAVRNRQDMKWKKFLYKQLCERVGIRICKSPSCGACVDYKICFGAEV